MKQYANANTKEAKTTSLIIDQTRTNKRTKSTINQTFKLRICTNLGNTVKMAVFGKNLGNDTGGRAEAHASVRLLLRGKSEYCKHKAKGIKG